MTSANAVVIHIAPGLVALNFLFALGVLIWSLVSRRAPKQGPRAVHYQLLTNGDARDKTKSTASRSPHAVHFIEESSVVTRYF